MVQEIALCNHIRAFVNVRHQKQQKDKLYCIVQLTFGPHCMLTLYLLFNLVQVLLLKHTFPPKPLLHFTGFNGGHENDSSCSSYVGAS